MLEGNEIKFKIRDMKNKQEYIFEGFIMGLNTRGLMICNKDNNPVFCINGLDNRTIDEIANKYKEYSDNQEMQLVFECYNHKGVSKKEMLKKCPFKQ